MFKRIRWMGIGAVAGAGASLWAEARMRRSLEAHPSVEIGARAARGLKNLGGELRDAVVDGREAMAAREAALRNQVGARFGAPQGLPPDGARLRLVPEEPGPPTPGSPTEEPGEDPHEPPTGSHPTGSHPTGSHPAGSHPAGRARRRLRSS